MKLFVVVVLLVVTLSEIYCADDTAVCVEDNKDSETPAAQINDAEGTPATAKSKRGIFNYGYGGGGGGAVHGLTYNIPLGTAAYPLYGFQKPWHTSPYAKFPSVYSTNFLAPHHPSHQHPVVHPVSSPSYILTPGSASVSSYNVNYPKYPFYSKPHIDFPLSYPKPTPSIFVQKPAIVPVGIPAFSNRIPIGRPAVLPPPHYHFIQAGSAASPAIYPVSSLQPQFIPIPLPAQPPSIHTFPTTLSTVPSFTTTTLASGTDGGATTLPGSHFITSGSSDSWRPIIVSHQHPTASTPTITVQRPAISLLPPYGSAPAGAGAAGDQQTHQQQIELQQTYEEYGVPQEQQHFSQAQQQQLSQLYLTPGDNSLDNNGGHLQLNGQEFAQGNQHLQQLQHQQQQHQQQQLIQEQQQIHSAGAFNGQAYEQASNNGRYAGPSSYEVQLGSYTRNV